MKLALFLPASESTWQSCRQILKSLLALYDEQAGIEVDRYVLPQDASLDVIDALAKKVAGTKYDALVFPSHQPHPYSFLSRYDLYDDSTALVFHCYGDFSIDARQWDRLSTIFKKRSVRFFAASTRQLKFLQTLMQDPSIVSYLPFLPDVKTFRYQPGLGEKLRKERGINDDEWVFLYSGRLSRQKHILELTSVFDRFISQLYPKAQLWLAGEFDDLGIPYIGRTELAFEHYQHWHALRESSSAKDRIHYLGNLSASELASYAQAADCGVFASTHNDEDFGLAPLELLMCGTPCFLTDWGGYADFVEPLHTRTISIDMKNFLLAPDMGHLTKQLFVLTATTKRPSHHQREECASYYHSKFNQRELCKLLKHGLKKPAAFSGFSQNMERLVAALERNPYAPFVDVTSFGGYNKEFEELYAPYFGRS